MAAGASATRWSRRNAVARTAPTPTAWTNKTTALRRAPPATPPPLHAPVLFSSSSPWNAPVPLSRRPATASTRSSTTIESSLPSRVWPTEASPQPDTKLALHRTVWSRTTWDTWTVICPMCRGKRTTDCSEDWGLTGALRVWGRRISCPGNSS